jgi:CNT family concentrative nucleoside transporter
MTPRRPSRPWIRHLLTASVMSAPAAFVMARVLVPETARRTPADESPVSSRGDADASNLLDAASNGRDRRAEARAQRRRDAHRVRLAARAGELADPRAGRLGPGGRVARGRGVDGLDLQTILGWLFAPLAWTMGVEWADAPLIGTAHGREDRRDRVHRVRDARGGR